MADLINAAGSVVGEDELIHIDGGGLMPFHGELGDVLLTPEGIVPK
jgi:hypothetical protein